MFIVGLAILLIVIGLAALLPFVRIPDTNNNLVNGLSPAMIAAGILLILMRVLD